MPKEDTLSPTPYDAAFKAGLHKDPSLIIPVVNEMFHARYPKDAPVKLLETESHEQDDHEASDKTVADSCFEVLGFARQLYIIECQSTPDEDMLSRLARYALRSAYMHRRDEEGGMQIDLPQVGVIYLREKARSLEGKALYVNIGDQRGLCLGPADLMARDYSLAQIRQSGLDFLVPFQPFRAEQALASQEKQTVLDATEDLANTVGVYLGERQDTRALSPTQTSLLYELFEHVMRGLTRKQSDDVKEEVDKIMAGSTLVLKGSSLWHAANIEGREEEQRENAFSMFLKGMSPMSVGEILCAPKRVVDGYYQEFSRNKDEILKQYQAKMAKIAE